MSRYFLNNIYYFITCPTINHQDLFVSDRKKLILDAILKSNKRFNIKNLDYGINSNHYHLLGYFNNGQIIPKFLKSINGPTALFINKFDNIKGRKVWDEYYVYNINNENLLNKIKGYVIGNPYKHNEVESLNDLQNYKYSSYNNYIKILGRERAKEMVLSTIRLSDTDFLKE